MEYSSGPKHFRPNPLHIIQFKPYYKSRQFKISYIYYNNVFLRWKIPFPSLFIYGFFFLQKESILKENM